MRLPPNNQSSFNPMLTEIQTRKPRWRQMPLGNAHQFEQAAEATLLFQLPKLGEQGTRSLPREQAVGLAQKFVLDVAIAHWIARVAFRVGLLQFHDVSRLHRHVEADFV